MHASSLIAEQICEFREGKISLTKDIVAEILAEAKSLHTKEELTHALSKRISQIQIFLVNSLNVNSGPKFKSKATFFKARKGVV